MSAVHLSLASMHLTESARDEGPSKHEHRPVPPDCGLARAKDSANVLRGSIAAERWFGAAARLAQASAAAPSVRDVGP